MSVNGLRTRRIVLSPSGDLVQDADEIEQLAAEGYRFYAGEATEFAEDSATAVAEALTASVGEGESHDGQAA